MTWNRAAAELPAPAGADTLMASTLYRVLRTTRGGSVRSSTYLEVYVAAAAFNDAAKWRLRLMSILPAVPL